MIIGNGITITGGMSFTTPTGAETDPYWSSVTLLLKADGSNGSSTIVDSSTLNKTITRNGTGGLISTAQSKFGGSSFLFQGDTWFDVPLGAGNADFTSVVKTCEAWVRLTTLGSQFMWGQCDSGASSPAMYMTCTASNAPRWYEHTGSGEIFLNGTTFSADNWVHIAQVCDGSLMRLYMNGNLAASRALTTTLSPNTSPFSIGRCGAYESGTKLFAYVDEFRFTKGVARYTSNFTPPTTSFPTS